MASCHTEKKATCHLKVDKLGNIIQCSKNSEEFFGITDLVNFNFFDLMARYNRTYYKSLFGEFPIMNMKSNTVLRFTLNHLENDLIPVAITCKVKPVVGYEKIAR